MNIGAGELIIVLTIVLLLFGANRLPSLARGLGSAMHEFRKGAAGEDDPAPNADGPATTAATDGDRGDSVH